MKIESDQTKSVACIMLTRFHRQSVYVDLWAHDPKAVGSPLIIKQTDARTKWSLCAAMLRRRHKNLYVSSTTYMWSIKWLDDKRPIGPHILHLSTMCHLFEESARAANFFFLLICPKNTNLVEDVDILLPVKFHWILYSSFRGEVENVSANQRPGQPSFFFRMALITPTW